MKIEKVKSRNTIGWVAIVTTLILLYASFFLLYIPKQELQLQERGFRILEEYAKNIHIKRDYYQNHLQNYGGFYVLKREGASTVIPQLQKGTTLSDDIDNVIESLDDEVLLELENAGREEYNEKGQGNYISYGLDSLKFETGELKYEVDNQYVHKYKGANVPIKKVMENLKFDALFENIALLDSSQVIYNSNGDVINSITNFNAVRDTISKTQGGIMLKLKIKGVDTQVLFLPFKFLGKDFFLAGFISNQQFVTKTRTIDNQFLSIISGILLLMLIGMPILKVVFIGREERLNVSDVYLSTISMMLGVSVLVLLFIGTMKYYVVDRVSAENRSDDISEKLIKNIDSDFEQLIALCDSVSEIDKHNKSGFWKDIDSFIKDSTQKYVNVPKETFAKNESLFPFNEIIFLNEKGTAVKAVTKTPFSDLVKLDLSSRDYYKMLTKSGQSWPSVSENFDAYYIESIKSYNTGAKETAISFRLKNRVKVGIDSADYLAITSHVPALYDQVLPPGVIFLIINKEGRVLFHSDDSKNLQENFVTETKNHPKVIGALNYNTSEKVKVIYNEKKWMAKIVPLKKKPFYHVTLLDAQHQGNKNTRVYLFTFYFLLFTFLCVFIGMQLIQFTGPRKSFLKTKNWSFDWLVYRTDKEQDYRLLLYVQSLLLFLQIMGFYFIKVPVSMLMFQLVFIAYSSYVAYSILNENKSLITCSMLLLIAFMLLVLFGVVNWPDYAISLSIFVVLFLISFVVQKKPLVLIFPLKFKITYLSYMFIWLCAIAVVPTLSYYYSIKLQEEILDKRKEMIHVAKSNLLSEEHDHNGIRRVWQSRVNGSGLDDLELEYTHENEMTEKLCDSIKKELHDKRKYKNAADVYSMLPSSLTEDEYLMSLQKNSNSSCDWWFSDSSLCFTETDTDGRIKVVSDELKSMQSSCGVFCFDENKRGAKRWWFYLILPVILLIILIWSTFKYQAAYLLNTVLANWERPKTPAFIDFILDNEIQKVMLIAFDGSLLFTKLKNKLRGIEPKYLSAEDFLYKKQNISGLLFNKRQVIWIYGLDNYLLNFKEGDLLLARIREIKTARCTVVFEMPYDMDFIKEYFEEYISDFKVDEDDEIAIIGYMRGLNQELKDFYRYTNSIEQESTTHDLQVAARKIDQEQNKPDERLLAIAHLMKMRYRYIWNNLSRMEKLILFDISDDGILNFKNKFLVNRLKMKGLLKLEPKPEVFDKSFQYFLKYAIKEEETIQLEQKLSKQGKWRNAKYMLLFLLVPLVAFMFISRGFSIEKIVGILSGVLALFAGAMRVMDTSLFSKTKS